MSVRAPYDPLATCPLWERTLPAIFNGDEQMVCYVQRALGYSLTGDVSEECFFLTWGSGRNGKGTIMNTVGWLLGDYADDLPFSTLAQREGATIPNDVAKLVGKRFVTSSETGGTVRLNEDRVKQFTGRDPVTARFLHQEFFTFHPVAKLWLAANHKPQVSDDSDGFWARVHLLPFQRTFLGREDKKLKDRLRKEEAPGILAWLVRGVLEWRRAHLSPPEGVKAATDDYRVESDPTARFFSEQTVTGRNAHVRASHLYDSYQKWCSENGTDPLNQKRFGQRVRQRYRFSEPRHWAFPGAR